MVIWVAGQTAHNAKAARISLDHLIRNYRLTLLIRCATLAASST